MTRSTIKTKIEARHKGVYAFDPSNKESKESFIRFVSVDLCSIGKVWKDDMFGYRSDETYMTRKQMIKFLEESLEMIKSGI